jgi:hypothetical protein
MQVLRKVQIGRVGRRLRPALHHGRETAQPNGHADVHLVPERGRLLEPEDAPLLARQPRRVEFVGGLGDAAGALEELAVEAVGAEAPAAEAGVDAFF